MRTRTAHVVVVLAVAAALAACAQEGDGSTDEAQSSIDVTATEFSFEPDAWTVPADSDVSVTLRNEGTIEHEWVVLAAGTRITSDDEFEEDLVEFEVEADTGDEATGTFQLPAGTYQVICAVPGHLAAGMEGELTVR
jgi:uncharacterized cupredoxin-like copper-binding protein